VKRGFEGLVAVGLLIGSTAVWAETGLTFVTRQNSQGGRFRLDCKASQNDAVRPGPGLLGRTLLEGKDIGIFFRYEHGKVFRHELVERKFIEKRDEKLPPRGVEVVLQGRLLIPRRMSVSARHAGGSVSHGVQTLFVDGKELGTVGDDRQKSHIYALTLEAGAHAVKWVLTGGRFGNNLLRFEDPDTGKPLSLSYSAEDLKDVGKIPRNDLTDAASEERGWPIPQGW
jgi:hypothetical protein